MESFFVQNLDPNAKEALKEVRAALAVRKGYSDIALASMEGLGAPPEVLRQITELGYNPGRTYSQVIRGPFIFVGKIPAAGVAAGAKIQDLLVYTGSEGPMSLELMPGFTVPTATPSIFNTMLLSTAFTLELDIDPGQLAQTTAALEVLSSLTLYHSYGRADSTKRRYIGIGVNAGTIAQSGVAVATFALGTNQAAYARHARPTEAFWPIYMGSATPSSATPIDTFQLQANGQAIPALGADLKFRLIVDGMAIQTIQDPALYREYAGDDQCTKVVSAADGLYAAKVIRQGRRNLAGRNVAVQG